MLGKFFAKMVMVIALALVVLALISSIAHNNMMSTVNVLILLMIVSMCSPQFYDIVNGEELSSDDSGQVLWWLFLGGALTELVNMLQSRSLKNYVGALTAATLTLLMLTLALPYRTHANHRSPFKTTTV